MRDVQLWWRLHDAPDAELVDALNELAGLTLRERTPFFGLVGPLASHDDPKLRCAAIAVLSGARGMHGMRAIVSALGDDDAATRAAAVEALASVAVAEPMRWAHAVFHPRADVRTAALSRQHPHSTNAHYGAYLRADPENRALAETLPFPKPGIGLLLGLWRRNAIGAEEAATKFSKAGQNATRAWVVGCHRRPTAWTRDFFRDALKAPALPAIEADDGLDQWVDIVMRAPDEAMAAAVGVMADAVLVGKLADVRPRLTVAVLRVLNQRPAAPLIELAAACEPRLLALPSFPKALQAAGLRGFVRYRKRIGRTPKTVLTKLLGSPLTRNADGSLNLFAAAAIGGLLPERRLRALVMHFGKEEIVSAIIASDEAWAALCDLPDEPGLWSTRLLAAVCEHDASASVRLTALALGRFAHHDNKALKRAASAAIAPAKVLVEIVAQAQAGRFTRGAALIMRLGNMLAPNVELGMLPDALAGLIALADREPTEPARAMLTALSAAVDAADFAGAMASLPEAAMTSLLDRFGEALPFRDGHQRSLAEALRESVNPQIQEWCAGFLHKAAPEPSKAKAATTARLLTPEESQRIATATDADLDGAIAPALAQPSTGLVAALNNRSGRTVPSVAVCVALVGCQDDMRQVAVLLDAYFEETDEFAEDVHLQVIAHWQHIPNGSLISRAWMVEFEKHTFAWLAFIDARPGGMGEVLTLLDGVPGAIARRRLWQACATALTLRRYRERHKLAGMFRLGSRRRRRADHQATGYRRRRLGGQTVGDHAPRRAQRHRWAQASLSDGARYGSRDDPRAFAIPADRRDSLADPSSTPPHPQRGGAASRRDSARAQPRRARGALPRRTSESRTRRCAASGRAGDTGRASTCARARVHAAPTLLRQHRQHAHGLGGRRSAARSPGAGARRHNAGPHAVPPRFGPSRPR